MEIAGIDAVLTVEQLMEIERIPLTRLEARKSAAQVAADAIATLTAGVKSYLNAAQKLATVAKFDRTSATVSNPAAVSATVGAGATVGSLSFTVDQLARAEGLRSTGSVASSAVAITSDSLLAVAAGTRKLGIATVRAGAGLAAGGIELKVTQASAAASADGSAALAASTMIDGTNNSLDVTVNGVAHTLTLATGTYNAAGLAAAVQSALDSNGVAATATIGDTGELVLATTREGSAATLQVTGGTSLGALNLAVDATARIGTDGIIDVGGTLTTLTSVEAGSSVAIDTGAGTLEATLSGGLRVGTRSVDVVDIGDGSLANVVSAINKTKNGVGASAVKVGDGQWLLQLNATATGEDGRIAIDGAVFSDLGGLVETSTAQNARITIGSGPGAYAIEAAGNTFTNVMEGVTLTAKEVSATPVTVTVARDDNAIVKDVAALVSAANDLIAQIKVQTRADPASGTKGPLAGDATARSLIEQVRSALADPIAGMSYLPYQMGIERDRDGGIVFKEATFRAALADDPEGVARYFARGGTSAGSVTFADATSATTNGTYAVDITTAATRAASGTLFDGGAAANSRVGIRIGSITATYDVTAGQSRDQIVDGINAALAAAGLKVVAEDDGTGLRVRAEDYGSAGDFELNTDVLGAGTWDALAGTDVVGTIDGVLATGVGRRLTLSGTADSPAAGLSVEVAEGATGTVNVDYLPGLAARVAEVADRLTRADTGILSSAQAARKRQVDGFDDQIDRFEDRLVVREANLMRYWTNLQTVLSGLQSQGDWLTSQLSSLSNNWAGT